jgi:hypothetical protein
MEKIEESPFWTEEQWERWVYSFAAEFASLEESKKPEQSETPSLTLVEFR